LTEDDEVMHEEILSLRQEYESTKQSTSPELLPDALVRALALREDERLSWQAVADQMNAEGLRTERGRLWSRANIWNHLTRKGIYAEGTSRSEIMRNSVKDRPRDYHGRWTTEETS
jgi:hypothetical protein